VPELFSAALYYLQENEATFARTAKEVRHPLVMGEFPRESLASRLRARSGEDPWAIVIRELAAAVAAAHQGYLLLQDATLKANAGPETALGEELGMVEFLFRTWQSAWHTIRFLRARERWGDTLRPEDREEMGAIAHDELQNARAARHLFSEHPWLNLKLRVDGEYPDSLAMLDMKVALLERSLEEDAGNDGGRVTENTANQR
jgi:hypothetical protein